MKLGDFNLLSFDCYGTLIDWESGIKEALAPWHQRENVIVSLEEILELHGQFEHELETEHPRMGYPELLGEVLRKIGAELDVTVTDDDAEQFGKSVGSWPAFADSIAALAHLKKHFTLVILSNVDRASFKYSNARLAVEFDFIFTAEEIGSYKPDPRNFNYMRGHLDDAGFHQDQHLHVAQSLFHDHVPAQALGYRTCWIDRRHGKQGAGATLRAANEPRHDFYFTSLAELAGAHQRELES